MVRRFEKFIIIFLNKDERGPQLQVPFLDSATNGGVRTEKGWARGKSTLLCLLFFSLQVAMFFLIFFFAITSCTKSLSEQSEAQGLIHTFNHSAKDSKKTKQLLTEML